MQSIYFRSCFWNSSSVLKMTANERLVYIYLITNDSTKPSGIYKFFIPDCVFRTGLKTKQVEMSLNKLHKLKMVIIFGDWIFVTRFLEETFNLKKKTLSDKIKIAIKKQFKEEKVPLELIACFHSVYHTLSIPYPYPLDTILDFRLETLDFRLEDINIGGLPPKDNAEIEILNSFDIFFQEYPNQKGEDDAKKAWGQVFDHVNSVYFFGHITDKLLNILLVSIKMQVEEKRKKAETNQFCPAWPLPATWLRGKRWKDKVEDTVEMDYAEQEYQKLKAKMEQK